jgi:hypothetical protein
MPIILLRLSIALLIAAGSAWPVSPPPDKPAGIGFNLGARIFFPGEINDYLEGIFDKMIGSHTVDRKFGSSDMFLGYPIRIKYMAPITSHFSAEPYLQYFLAPKILYLSGGDYENVFVILSGFNPGANAWFKFAPARRVTIKAGGGAFASWNFLGISGDLGSEEFSGFGWGGTLLGGLDVTFRRLAINVDLGFVLGSTPVTRHSGGLYEVVDRAPKHLNQTGFEIRPGCTWHF